MGRVYKVIDREVRAKVALKLIRPEIAGDPAVIDRFREGLTPARGLAHNNICRMFDLGRDGDAYFLTMEYVSGQDLCLGSEGAPTASDSGGYVNSRAEGQRRPL